jgi:hypothetical protein
LAARLDPLTRWLWILPVAVSLGFALAGIALIGATPPSTIPVGLRLQELPAYLVLQVSFSGVGALLSARRPGNPVGWSLVTVGIITATQFLTAGYAVYGLSQGLPWAAHAGWVYSWLGVFIGVPLGLALVTFPDGRLRTRWARTAVGLMPIFPPLVGAALAFRPGPLNELPGVPNPVAWEAGGGVLTAALIVGGAAGALGLMAIVKHLWVLAGRSTGIERQQVKWIVWSAALIAFVSTPSSLFIFGQPGATGAAEGARWAARVAVALASATFPAAIAVAVLRYRLYEIDVLVNKTLVYGAVSAVLIGTYTAGVIVFQALLRPVTAGSDIGVAAATLFVVALFQPLRGRVQAFVDRRFYRSRYNAARTFDAFSARLRGDVELESVRADLIGVVADTVRPAHASLWLR